MAVKTEETFRENMLREEWRRQTLKNTHAERRFPHTTEESRESREQPSHRVG